MNLWKTWKTAFDAWENNTAQMLDPIVRSRAVLEPAGFALSSAMKIKAMSDRITAAWWGSLGLPTKQDQERTLHKLNTLESRLLDLEEQLEDARGQ
ncbi:MAG: hypothetical protein ACE37F_16625 [Nannocystaceae bacterium]|nr:hypothetical protein [bacterium]